LEPDIICRENVMSPMSGKRPDRMPIRPKIKARVQAVVERVLGPAPAPVKRRRRRTSRDEGWRSPQGQTDYRGHQ
jgi:hypothetical protein